MAEKLVVESRVREALKSVKGAQDIRVDAEAIDALDERVNELVKNAVKRAVDNGRKTVRPVDF